MAIRGRGKFSGKTPSSVTQIVSTECVRNDDGLTPLCGHVGFQQPRHRPPRALSRTPRPQRSPLRWGRFVKFNSQAGINHVPRVHAIVMTHCGWNRQRPNNPDSSARFFIEQALNIAQGYEHVFSESDISKCFYLLDDFHSSGRISGNQTIPLAKLVSGKKGRGPTFAGQARPWIAISAKWPISRPHSHERAAQLRRPYLTTPSRCASICAASPSLRPAGAVIHPEGFASARIKHLLNEFWLCAAPIAANLTGLSAGAGS